MANEQVNRMIGDAANQIVSVLAKHHDFELPINLAEEGLRFLNLVDLCESPAKYSELSAMDEKLFVAARLEIRIQLNNALSRAMS